MAEIAARPEGVGRLGMWLFLATETMMFGALFLALAVCRWRVAEAWKEASAHLHLWMGTANTAVLLTSSLAVAFAAQKGRARWWFAVAALLGLAFLGIKGTEYVLEYRDGLMPGVGPAFQLSPGARLFFDLYFVATGLHAVHLGVGVGLLAFLILRDAEAGAVEAAGLYWHFVDIVWVFLFPIFYLAAPR